MYISSLYLFIVYVLVVSSSSGAKCSVVVVVVWMCRHAVMSFGESKPNRRGLACVSLCVCVCVCLFKC